MNFWVNIVGALDGAIHKFIVTILNLIFEIAEVNIFDADIIGDFTEKIYGILGVVILLKIVISAVTYLVNPDKMLDKKEGVGGLLQRTIISVALLALVPTIFKFAKNLQIYISEAIPKIILSDDINTGTVGEDMSFMTLKVFITAKDESKAKQHPITNLDEFAQNIAEGCTFTDGNPCIYDYNWFFSIAVGLFILYILFSMGLDIGIRTIKMGLLQIFAPIPISSYINSEEKFKKWYETAFKVYADLFIRLIVIYFIIFLVDSFTQHGLSVGTTDQKIAFGDKPLLFVYIIVALLMFAKSAPKFICDIIGIDSSGEGIADMFKPAWQRAGGFAAIGGMATAGFANAANRLQGWKKMSAGQRLKAAVGAVTSGAAGAASAGLHGGIAALQGKNGSDVMAAGHKRAVQARQNRDLDRMNGVGFMDRLKARSEEFLGWDTNASLAEGRQKAYSTVHQDVGNFKKAVMGRITKTANVAMVEGAGTATSMLGQLLARNMDAINASGNQDLINYARKFDITRDASGNWVSNGLRQGVHISYHDLAAINADAVQSGIGSISSMTGENGALTLQAQKDLFAASMNGQIVDTNEKKIDQLNVGNKNTHTDISTAVGNALQHIAENAVSLGEFSSDIRYTDEDGTVRTADKSHPVKGAEMFINAFTTDFGKLDDVLQRRSFEVSSEMSSDRGAAARASIQRRDSNNKSGK